MVVKKHWRVVGYDSTTQIFEKVVPLGSLSQKQMAEALRVLAARAGLTFEEILDCHARKVLYDVRRESVFHCYGGREVTSNLSIQSGRAVSDCSMCGHPARPAADFQR